jgi:glutamine synthetase
MREASTNEHQIRRQFLTAAAQEGTACADRAPGVCAVAAAILDWGIAEDATNFSHVFQPLGAVGVRHGVTGQLHNQLFTFGSDGKPEFKFKGGELLRGETDGSSYPNGGLRSKCKLKLP